MLISGGINNSIINFHVCVLNTKWFEQGLFALWQQEEKYMLNLINWIRLDQLDQLDIQWRSIARRYHACALIVCVGI